MTDPAECQGCGAMLPPPDAEGHVTCLSCGQQSRASRLAPPPPKDADLGIPGIGVPRVTTYDNRASTQLRNAPGCAKAAVVSAIVLFVVSPLVIIGFVVLGVITTSSDSGSGSGSDHRIVISVADVTPAAPGAAKTWLTVLEQETDGSSYDRYLSKVVVGERGAEREWRSASLGRDTSTVQVAQTGTGVVAVVEDRLLVISSTGETTWEARLPDVISGGCDTCLLVVGSAVVVQTADGQLQGYGLGSSERQWSRTLGVSNAAVVSTGEHLVVVDDPADGDPFVEVVDPATGRATGRAATPCAGSQRSMPTTVAPIPDEDAVLLLAGYSSACASRYDATAGTAGPDRPLPDDLYVDPSMDDPLLFVGDEVVLPVRDTVALLDVGTGSVRRLPVPDGTTARSAEVFGDTLVATTTAARGTPVGGLAAWDLTSERLVWSTRFDDRAQVLERDATFGDTVFPGSPLATLGRDGDRPVLLTFRSEDASTVSIAPVDLSSGELGPAEDHEVDDGPASSYSVTMLDDGPARLVFLVDWQLQSVAADGSGFMERYPS
ncbi:MAG: PQQ-binding-like beta-propeller repeat protein [Actinobacteria bacterium]|nr:PQQ-binding-like beta-propeller repeat protein [Actinomycetota bacterium]